MRQFFFYIFAFCGLVFSTSVGHADAEFDQAVDTIKDKLEDPANAATDFTAAITKLLDAVDEYANGNPSAYVTDRALRLQTYLDQLSDEAIQRMPRDKLVELIEAAEKVEDVLPVTAAKRNAARLQALLEAHSVLQRDPFDTDEFKNLMELLEDYEIVQPVKTINRRLPELNTELAKENVKAALAEADVAEIKEALDAAWAIEEMAARAETAERLSDKLAATLGTLSDRHLEDASLVTALEELQGAAWAKEQEASRKEAVTRLAGVLTTAIRTLTDKDKEDADLGAALLGLQTAIKVPKPKMLIHILSARYGQFGSKSNTCDARPALLETCQQSETCMMPGSPVTSLCGFDPAPFVEAKDKGLHIHYECKSEDADWDALWNAGSDEQDTLKIDLRSETQVFRCTGANQ